VRGDGSRYVVEAPFFNDDRYAGKYDFPIEDVPRRVKFMPADLVNALDTLTLMYGRTQVPRQRGNVMTVDNVLVAEGSSGPVMLLDNSVAIDKQVKRLQYFAKYDDVGREKAFVRLGDFVTIRGYRGKTADVPTRITILYPLEGTTFDIRLSVIKVNDRVRLTNPRLFETGLGKADDDEKPGNR
jgi:hypothetical protein